MATHRVRLFVLTAGHALTERPEEKPSFTIDAENDDAARERIRSRLEEWGYTIRAVSALVVNAPRDAAYAATVVAPQNGGPF